MPDTAATGTSSMRLRPILAGWALAIGVDLFFNAGLFVRLFDQDREPGLLADTALFRRVPIAYVTLMIGVIALAWLFDRLDVSGMRDGAVTGVLFGFVAASLGIVLVWTAIDMTGWFVGAGIIVQLVEFGAVGAFLGAYRGDVHPRRVAAIAVGIACTLAVVGIVFQNLLQG